MSSFAWFCIFQACIGVFTKDTVEVRNHVVCISLYILGMSGGSFVLFWDEWEERL